MFAGPCRAQREAIGIAHVDQGSADLEPFLHLGSKCDFVAWAQQLLAGGGYSLPINGYFQPPTQSALFAFQSDHGLPLTGNLDVPTWSVLLQNKPLAVRWTKGGAVAAGPSPGVVLPPPKSAQLPAVRDEIPPPSKRAAR